MKLVKIILIIMLFGIIGRLEYDDNMMMSNIDKQNKQEVIKDIQLRCFTGELQDNILCKMN